MAKAQRLQAEMNELLPEERRTKLTFSTGWLCNFQKRCNLQSLKSHGESGDADMTAIERELPRIRQTVKLYNPNDVFNADEFGHFYRLAPDRTIAVERLPGRKKDKVRLTYLACCNATGTEKLPLMCIGKALRPRCFKKKRGQELGFDYHANRKAWMTSALFFGWLLRFSSYISRTGPERKVLLLIDNCSAHGSEQSLPAVDNVDVVFLPPNTTSKLQPLDAGIIAALKTRYRKWQYERALDCVDASVENIYHVDQLSAMKALTYIWEQLPKSVLSKCWAHTGLLSEEAGAFTRDETMVAGVLSAMGELCSSRARHSLEFVLNPDGEDNVIEEVDEATMARETVNEIMEVENDQDDEEEEESYLDKLAWSERMRSVVVVKHLFESFGVVDPLVVNSLRSLHRELKHSRASAARQTRISDFFD